MTASLKTLLEPVLTQLPQINLESEVEVLQELPIETLFLALKEADTETALWFYQNSINEQVQGLIDIDCWDGAEFLPSRFENHFKLMALTDAERLATLMKNLDPEIIVRGLLEWFSVEDFDPQNPPEVEESKLLITLDQKYALILKTEDPEIREVIYLWVNKLSAGDIDSLRRHLESCKWEQISDLEEHGYKFKKGRIEDMGFVDYYDALAMYARGNSSQLKDEMLKNPLDASAKYPSELYPGEDTEAFVETEFLPNVISDPLLGEGIIRDALLGVEDSRKRNVILMELLRTVNAALAADKLLHEELSKVALSAKRSRCYLELGLIYLSDGDKARASQLMQVQPLGQVFHLGWLTVQDIVAAVKSLKLAFGSGLFSEKDQELLNQLQGRHPELSDTQLRELNLLDHPGTLLTTKSLLVVGERLKSLAAYAKFFLDDLEAGLEFKKRPLMEGESALARLLTGLFRQSCNQEFLCTPISVSEWHELSIAYDAQKLAQNLDIIVKRFNGSARELFKLRVMDLAEDIDNFISSNTTGKTPDPRFFKALVFEKAVAK